MKLPGGGFGAMQKAIAVVSHKRSLQHADGVHLFALVDKLRGVMKDEDRLLIVNALEAFAGSIQMAAQNRGWTDTWVGEKTVGGFGICPVLASPRHAAPLAEGDGFQSFMQALAVAWIGEHTAR
jgi:hypothetical protein